MDKPPPHGPPKGPPGMTFQLGAPKQVVRARGRSTPIPRFHLDVTTSYPNYVQPQLRQLTPVSEVTGQLAGVLNVRAIEPPSAEIQSIPDNKEIDLRHPSTAKRLVVEAILFKYRYNPELTLTYPDFLILKENLPEFRTLNQQKVTPALDKYHKKMDTERINLLKTVKGEPFDKGEGNGQQFQQYQQGNQRQSSASSGGRGMTQQDIEKQHRIITNLFFGGRKCSRDQIYEKLLPLTDFEFKETVDGSWPYSVFRDDKTSKFGQFNRPIMPNKETINYYFLRPVVLQDGNWRHRFDAETIEKCNNSFKSFYCKLVTTVGFHASIAANRNNPAKLWHPTFINELMDNMKNVFGHGFLAPPYRPSATPSFTQAYNEQLMIKSIELRGVFYDESVFSALLPKKNAFSLMQGRNLDTEFATIFGDRLTFKSLQYLLPVPQYDIPHDVLVVLSKILINYRNNEIPEVAKGTSPRIQYIDLDPIVEYDCNRVGTSEAKKDKLRSLTRALENEKNTDFVYLLQHKPRLYAISADAYRFDILILMTPRDRRIKVCIPENRTGSFATYHPHQHRPQILSSTLPEELKVIVETMNIVKPLGQSWMLSTEFHQIPGSKSNVARKDYDHGLGLVVLVEKLTLLNLKGQFQHAPWLIRSRSIATELEPLHEVGGINNEKMKIFATRFCNYVQGEQRSVIPNDLLVGIFNPVFFPNVNVWLKLRYWELLRKTEFESRAEY